MFSFVLQSTLIMTNTEEQLAALQDIRKIMERSSRFISLNGLSGVFVGLFALAGAALAYLHLSQTNGRVADDYDAVALVADKDIWFYCIDAIVVLVLSVGVSTLLSIRKANKEGLNFWDPTAKRLLLNMLIPLVTGGLFCLILILHNFLTLIAPTLLIFYGLALVNSSKYTLEDIRYLGLLEICLGLLAAYFPANGLVFWAIGFGFLHIVYGIGMYIKYDKKVK